MDREIIRGNGRYDYGDPWDDAHYVRDQATLEARPVLSLPDRVRTFLPEETLTKLPSWAEWVGMLKTNTDPNPAGFHAIHVSCPDIDDQPAACFDEHGKRLGSIDFLRVVITPTNAWLEVIEHGMPVSDANGEDRGDCVVHRYLCVLENFELRGALLGDVSVEALLPEPSAVG